LRLAIVSDIHVECAPWEPRRVDADVIVLGGDIATTPEAYRAVVEDVHERNPDARIFCLLGNHEFYGLDLATAPAAYAKALTMPGVDLLDCGAVTIDGWRFAGATMWSDLSDPLDAETARQRMNDYRMIRNRGPLLTPKTTTQVFRRAVAFIRHEMEDHPGGRTVVLTHHAPSFHSAGPHGHDDLTPAYCSGLNWLIRTHGPALWIHGHTHSVEDYVIGRTRIVANPRGYAGRELTGWNPGLVIDLDALPTAA